MFKGLVPRRISAENLPNTSLRFNLSILSVSLSFLVYSVCGTPSSFFWNIGHAADFKMKVREERKATPNLELREGFVIYRVPRVCRVVSGNAQVKLTLH